MPPEGMVVLWEAKSEEAQVPARSNLYWLHTDTIVYGVTVTPCGQSGWSKCLLYNEEDQMVCLI